VSREDGVGPRRAHGRPARVPAGFVSAVSEIS
jgi:hypothetical protein